MATSQNGWVAYTSSDGLVPLSWITGRVRPGDVHTIFDYLGKKFNSEVEPIRKDWSWGWNYRPVRGSSSLSNHASATAVDFNAPSHPLGASGTFSSSQMRSLRRILDSLDGVVRWGGDYSGRKDEMHFEINRPAQHVAAIADKIRRAELGVGGGGGSTTPNPTPNPTPTPTPEEDDMFTDEDRAKVNYIFSAIAPGESGVRPLGHLLAAVLRAEAEAKAAKDNTRPITRGGVEISLRQEIANIGTAVTNLPTVVWSYKNVALDKVNDAFAFLRQAANK